MFIYPITIVLIVLNVLPERWASPAVFKMVVLVTFIFSIPDFLKSINITNLEPLKAHIPLAEYGISWFLPSVSAYVIALLIERFTQQAEPLQTEH